MNNTKFHICKWQLLATTAKPLTGPTTLRMQLRCNFVLYSGRGTAIQSLSCKAASSITFSFHLHRAASSLQDLPLGGKKWKRKLHLTAAKGSTARSKSNTAQAVTESTVKPLHSQPKHFRKWNATMRNLSRQSWETKEASRKHLASWKRCSKALGFPPMKMVLEAETDCDIRRCFATLLTAALPGRQSQQT